MGFLGVPLINGGSDRGFGGCMGFMGVYGRGVGGGGEGSGGGWDRGFNGFPRGALGKWGGDRGV